MDVIQIKTENKIKSKLKSKLKIKKRIMMIKALVDYQNLSYKIFKDGLKENDHYLPIHVHYDPRINI